MSPSSPAEKTITCLLNEHIVMLKTLLGKKVCPSPSCRRVNQPVRSRSCSQEDRPEEGEEGEEGGEDVVGGGGLPVVLTSLPASSDADWTLALLPALLCCNCKPRSPLRLRLLPTAAWLWWAALLISALSPSGKQR